MARVGCSLLLGDRSESTSFLQELKCDGLVELQYVCFLVEVASCPSCKVSCHVSVTFDFLPRSTDSAPAVLVHQDWNWHQEPAVHFLPF